MTAANTPQVIAEATPEVKAKLRQLEADLAYLKAREYEIVGVLIKRASAQSVPAADLFTYRNELAEARRARTARSSTG
jgi:hypothetical protein